MAEKALPRLECGHWPDRKRPLLTLHRPDMNECVVLATFQSDEAMNLFMECAKKGIAMRQTDDKVRAAIDAARKEEV